MAPVDIFFLIVVAFFLFRGMIVGFIAEFMNMAALFGGIAAGILAQPYMNPILSDLISTENSINWIPILSFFVVFLVSYIIIKLFEILFHKVVDKIHLNQLDRILGVMWGLLEASVTVLFIVFIADIQPYFDLSDIFGDSIFAGYARELLKELGLTGLGDIPVIGEIGV